MWIGASRSPSDCLRVTDESSHPASSFSRTSWAIEMKCTSGTHASRPPLDRASAYTPSTTPRSTNIPRTMESLQQIVHGLYPTKKCHPDQVPPLLVRYVSDDDWYINVVFYLLVLRLHLMFVPR